jgi:transketolase
MGAISQANIKCVGSHVGVSIGEDGPSQMALEDLAMFRAIPGSIVLYPSDGVSTEYACELAAQNKGIVFIRTSRPDTAIVYANDEKFAVGKSKVVKQSAQDQVLVIGGGVTLHEALKAHALLQQENINIRVLDIFSVKPIDAQGIAENAKAVGGRVITVEDHYPEGGIGEVVASVLPANSNHVALAVREIPRSGPPTLLLNKYGIDASSIVKAVKSLLSK